MKSQDLKQQILKEFIGNNIDELGMYLGNPESFGAIRRKDNLAWLSAALDAFHAAVVREVGEWKAAENCAKGKESHGKCPACAERTGWNKAISKVIEVLSAPNKDKEE